MTRPGLVEAWVVESSPVTSNAAEPQHLMTAKRDGPRPARSTPLGGVLQSWRLSVLASVKSRRFKLFKNRSGSAGRILADLRKRLSNTVEVGGVEPAATPFREFPFRLLNASLPCSEHVFGLTPGNPSLPFGAFKPRQVRVTASFTRHVSAHTIGLLRCHVPWPQEGSS